MKNYIPASNCFLFIDIYFLLYREVRVQNTISQDKNHVQKMQQIIRCWYNVLQNKI